MSALPFRLAPFFSPRIWGDPDWSRWYDGAAFKEPVGEAWLTGPECVVETGPWTGHRFAEVVKAHGASILGEGDTEFPLLLKLLMPREMLSLQVHPDDIFAQKKGFPRGKTECWYVLDAEPGAAVALGFKDEEMSGAAVRSAIADATLEEHMRWLPVKAGEMIFVDAGTVHAIGPGMTLLETQQTSDTTYRLYDYGRPRELHIDEALEVMLSRTRAGKREPVEGNGYTRLIAEQYFTVDRIELKSGERRELKASAVPQIVVSLEGEGALDALALERGKAIVIPAGAACAIKSTKDLKMILVTPGQLAH